MSQATLEAHYLPNWRISQAFGFAGYNCGYRSTRGGCSFADHQINLVWQLLGDTPIGPTSTVLDIGCGIGGPTGWIHERYHPERIIGLELCLSSVRAAQSRLCGDTARTKFVQGDAQCLPVASGCVDVIFNLESALHYVNKPAFLAECRRVLKCGGTLCLGDITTHHKFLFSSLGLLNRLPTQFNSNLRLWSARDYGEALPEAGFRITRHEDVTRSVADSLIGGLEEIRRRGWKASRGFRARVIYLSMLEKLLRARRLTYDLFNAAAVN